MPQKPQGATHTRSALLSAREGKALEVLLGGGTIVEAAQAARVATKTIQRWLSQPQYATFQEEYRWGIETIRKHVAARLAARLDKSMDILDRVLDPKTDAEWGLRLKAAQYVIDKVLPDMSAPSPAPLTAVQVNVTTGLSDAERQTVERIRAINPENATRLEQLMLAERQNGNGHHGDETE